MKKTIAVIALALVLCGVVFLFASCTGEIPTPVNGCAHENAEISLQKPAGLFAGARYTYSCPDCGFTVTQKEARGASVTRGFDFLVGGLFKAPEKALSENFTVTAHTGPGEIPMNSKFSLRYQLDSGADVVEFDLTLNSAGEAVLSHGDPDEAKMTLDEAFAMVAGYYGTQVNVDVKNKEAVAAAQECAIRYGVLDRIFYTGVGEGDMAYVKEHSPLVPCYLNGCTDPDPEACADLCKRAVEMGAVGLNFSYNDYSPELAKAARENGLLISVYTVNWLKDMRKVLGYDVDNITTEFPYKLFVVTADAND